MKLEFSRQIFFKSSHIKIHENPSSGSRVVPCEPTDEQTDMRKLFATLRTCLRIKGPEDSSLTYMRSSVWYINIGYLHSSSVPYRTNIYDWTNAVSPPTPLLLVWNTQTSGRSFSEPPSGRLQGKIMPWRVLRYHVKSQSPPVKNGASTETMISYQNPFFNKTWFRQEAPFFRRNPQLLHLIPNRHSETFRSHVSFPSKVRANAGYTLIFWLFQFNALQPYIVLITGIIAATLYRATKDTELLIASVRHSSTFKTREGLCG
jgi:hypothetical protein